MNMTVEAFYYLLGMICGFAIATWAIPHKHRKIIGAVATTVAALLTLLLAAGRAAGN